MNTEEIKLTIFRQVDTLDENMLNEFYGIMQNFINSKVDVDEWNGLTETEIQGIEAAIQELDAGKGIPHEQVMDRLRKKYTHA